MKIAGFKLLAPALMLGGMIAIGFHDLAQFGIEAFRVPPFTLAAASLALASGIALYVWDWTEA